MGNPASKIGHEIKEIEVTQGSLPSTPISTPKVARSQKSITDCDPRSPSANIVRTPILLTPDLDKEGTAGDTIALETDPRSPTVEFDRTPILVHNSSKGSKPLNKNSENVRKTILCSNAFKMLRHDPQPREAIPPRLLETTTKTVKHSEKRKSFVGLLETNLDFVETDLDVASQKKSPAKTPEVPKEEILIPKPSTLTSKPENIDPRSPTTDFTRTPLQIVKKLGEIELNEDSETLSDCEEKKEVREEGTELNEIVDKLEETPDIKEPESIAVSQVDSEETIKSSENEPNLKIEASEVTSVCEFDKKLTTLIYEDKTVALNREKNRHNRDRTPLGVRNANSTKSVAKLKVSDKPRKSDHAVSRIPVFKEKLIKGKLHPCENTPPANVGEKSNKSKKSQWDADNTLII